MTQDSPDTIALLSPASPYFCVGFHQNPAEELDLDWCERQGYPVLHRKIGGGTVYLDRNQLFYQCIFHRSRAPFDVASIYRRFLSPPVEALRGLGLPARLSGVNEIEVRDRRIAGTGGGQIGEAVVVVGNLLFDFPYEVMARAWRVPSQAFRRLAAEGLRRCLTTLGREIAVRPAMAGLTHLIAECYAEALGRPLVAGALTEGEEWAIAGAEAEVDSKAAFLEKTDRPRRGLKIAGSVYVRECTRQTLSGPLRLTLRLRGEIVDALAVSPSRWRALARAVEGSRMDQRTLRGQLGGAQGGAELVDALLAMNGARHGG
jgi:lipoate-protein ligase A